MPSFRSDRHFDRITESGARGAAAKAGVRIDHPKQLFCVRRAMEAFADEQPSLMLLSRATSETPGLSASGAVALA
jgi:hypothetical protein